MHLARNYRNATRHGVLVHQANPVVGITQPTAPYFASYVGSLVRAYAVGKGLPIPAAAPSVVLQYHTGKAAYYRVTWWVPAPDYATSKQGRWPKTTYNVVARVAINARNMARTRVLSVKYQ
jgi:hypothetical protein